MALTDQYLHRLDGHDGSHWQYDAGPVDLTVLALRTFWLSWKATQSTKYNDPTFARVKDQVRVQRLFTYFLPYHWLSSTTDPEAQANHFLRAIGNLRPGEGTMLDAEENGITVPGCLNWLEAVEEETRRPSSVYTGLYVAGGTIWRSQHIRNSKYGPRPMHLAAYITRASLLSRLNQLGVAGLPIHAWQYSSNGPVPGITGRADMNTIIDRLAYDLACSQQQKPTPIPEKPPVVIPPVPVQEDDDMKVFLVQDNRGVFVTGDYVMCRPCAPEDIEFFARKGRVDMDGPSAVVEQVDNGFIDRMLNAWEVAKKADVVVSGGTNFPSVPRTFTGDVASVPGVVTLHAVD